MYGDTPSVADAAEWADHYGLTTPVLIDVDEQVANALRDNPGVGVPLTESLLAVGNRLAIRDTPVSEDDIVDWLE